MLYMYISSILASYNGRTNALKIVKKYLTYPKHDNLQILFLDCIC